MATVENRSRYIVSVENRDDLTKTFACNRGSALKKYIAKLKSQGQNFGTPEIMYDAPSGANLFLIYRNSS